MIWNWKSTRILNMFHLIKETLFKRTKDIRKYLLFVSCACSIYKCLISRTFHFQHIYRNLSMTKARGRFFNYWIIVASWNRGAKNPWPLYFPSFLAILNFGSVGVFILANDHATFHLPLSLYFAYISNYRYLWVAQNQLQCLLFSTHFLYAAAMSIIDPDDNWMIRKREQFCNVHCECTHMDILDSTQPQQLQFPAWVCCC